MNIHIAAGRVIDPASGFDATADVVIVDGLVRAIGRPDQIDIPRDAQRIGADGLIVAPGLVDMHVHLREPGYEYKETIAGGSRAAAAGGVTSMAAMPNTRPVVDDTSIVGYILQQAQRAGLARVYPIGAITQGLQGEQITEMGLLQQAGCVAFSDDGRAVMNSAVMRRALDYSRAFGALIIQHAEDSHLSGHGCMHEGVISSRLGLPGIPAVAEESLVERDIRLVEITGGRYHVAHISTSGAVEAVAWAQQKGLPVSCEVAPHHFALTDAAVAHYDTNAKMSPPLRSESHRQSILMALSKGIITVIATDHAPHEPDSKEVEFCRASNGVVGLETLLPMALELIRDGVLDWRRCLATITCNPARLLGIQAGQLAEGQPADLVLFDAEEKWHVDAAKLHGTSRNTCFHGRHVQGRVKMTFLSGRAVHNDETD
ncbi:MAG: dihydroorotase [Magnetococcales bacterium]|nr:dihydroorotase [Magnetococcales bacterium]